MNRASRTLSTSQGLLAVQLVLQLLANFFFAFWYKANPNQAFVSVQAIQQHAIPSFFLSLQYWGGQLLFLHALLHLMGMLVWGTCSSEWIPRWYLSIITLLGSYVLLATGNFILFDRHGVQSAVIEIAIVNRIPFFGPVFSDWVRGGPKLGGNTLTLWYAMHQWITPLLLLAYGGVGFLYRRYDDESRASYPLIGFCAVVPILVAIFMGVPLGTGATKVNFTSFDAVVNWYAWPLHGSLRAFEAISPSLGWIGAIVLPSAFVGFLFCLPWLCRRVTQVFAQTLFVIFAAVFLVLSIFFGGIPASPFGRAYLSNGVATTLAKSSKPTSAALFNEGKKEFAKNRCSDCHGIDGSDSNSGPDLTQENKKHADLEWYKAWIHDPSSVRASATMPAFKNLTDEQLSALGEYIRKPR